MLEGEVEGFSVGSFDVVIHAPVDVEAVYRRGEREGLRG
jgi:hypothetical protein